MVHGFFVSMGGFVKPEGCRLHPIASHVLAEGVAINRNEDGENDGVAAIFENGIPVEPKVNIERIIDIDCEEIQDRSKGDEISKGIALLQTMWFMIQCIARARQHLPLTELEIVTLAFASLNVVIRLIWWDKPLDVRYPIKIGPKVTSGMRAEGVDVSTWDRILTDPVPSFVDVTLVIFEGEVEDSFIPKTATRVPTLWAGRLSPRKRGRAAAISIALAMGFGGIHFAAWGVSFPSGPEKILWQVASIAVVAVPFIFFVGATIVLSLGAVPGLYHTIIFRLVIPLGVLVYVIARIILMVLPFMSLRSLPPEVFKDIQWTDFIPHIS
jgi:hypothetical protein